MVDPLNVNRRSKEIPFPFIYLFIYLFINLQGADFQGSWGGGGGGCGRTRRTPGYGLTTRHLHQRISEHRYSAIGRHLDAHHENKRTKISYLFKVLKKCRSKLDCLIYEMLFIKDIKPSLNTQSDSIRAKLFT